jgi:hypothetical protein
MYALLSLIFDIHTIDFGGGKDLKWLILQNVINKITQKWFKTCLAPDDDSTVVALQPFIGTLKEHLRDLDRKGLSMEKKLHSNTSQWREPLEKEMILVLQ